MKRMENLYQNIVDFNNIENSYNEVRRNTRNERRVQNMKEYKSVYISRVHEILENKEYKVGPYNKFIIYELKERLIVSQNIQDKIVNHLVARHILYPALLPCLLDINVASRKNMGTSKGLFYSQKFHKKCKKTYRLYLYNSAGGIFHTPRYPRKHSSGKVPGL